MPNYVGRGGSAGALKNLVPYAAVSAVAAACYFLLRTQIIESFPDYAGLILVSRSLDWSQQILCVAILAAVAPVLGALFGRDSPWRALGGLASLSIGAVLGMLYLHAEHDAKLDILPAVAIPGAVLIYGLVRENFRKERAMFVKEMALLHKDTLLRTVFESTYDGIFVANEDGEIIYANQSALGLFGYDEKDIIGRNLETLNPTLREGSAARPIGHYLRLAKLENRQVGPFQTTGLRRNGKAVNVELTVGTVRLKSAPKHPMERRKGDRFLYICNVWDAAIRTRLDEMHRGGSDDEIMADRAMAEFVANISHELRTPLNAIIGFSELLDSPALGPTTEKQKEYLGDIHNSASHLLKIINDILDISKIESGNAELREQEVSVEDMVASCIKLVEKKASDFDIKVRASALPRNHRLYVDERQIKQVLINLLSNAVKFTPPGGDVEVSGAIEADGSFTLAVSDSGIGIPAEDIPIVLAPFGQIDSGLDRKYEGTGLGLPLAKRLVESHGGTLAIKSFLGIGTTVSVSLPKERVHEARGVAAV